MFIDVPLHSVTAPGNGSESWLSCDSSGLKQEPVYTRRLCRRPVMCRRSTSAWVHVWPEQALCAYTYKPTRVAQREACICYKRS